MTDAVNPLEVKQPPHPLMQLPQPPAPGEVRKPVQAPSLTQPIYESQFKISHYTIPLPAGHEPKDLAEPTYWQHHARKLKLHDVLDCLSFDGTWEVTLRVIAKGDTWVRMRCLRVFKSDTPENTDAPAEALYDIKPAGHGRFNVVHKESKALIAGGCQSRDEAIRARDEHIANLRKR